MSARSVADPYGDEANAVAPAGIEHNRHAQSHEPRLSMHGTSVNAALFTRDFASRAHLSVPARLTCADALRVCTHTRRSAIALALRPRRPVASAFPGACDVRGRVLISLTNQPPVSRPMFRRRSPALRPQILIALSALVVVAGCAGDGSPESPPLSGNPADFTWQLPPGWAAPTVPADNPMSPAKVELGRRLFYDTRLSGNGGFSCASCHRQEFAFADARNIAVGSTGEPHPRNSIGLANAAWLARFNWRDPFTPALEEQASVPLFNDRPVELGLKGLELELLDRLRAVALYRQLFGASFPGQADPFTEENLLRAIAAFERTIIALNSPFDRAHRGESGAMSAAAQRGEQLFNSPALHCAECHRGPLFTAAADVTRESPVGDDVFANNGLYNIGGDGSYPSNNRGLMDATGRAADMGKFRIPTLRNLAFTFPYMHDGSISTLEDVVEHYARGGRLITVGPNAGDGNLSPLKDPRIAPLNLTAQQKSDLVAFLRSLSDTTLMVEPRFSNPWNGR